MAAEEDVDTLKLYWDHFFKAETGTYEKSTWLDLFLAEFLIRVKDGAKPKELINFCPVSGVVTLVGCELLCGVHRVTSSVHAHAAPPATGNTSHPHDEPSSPEVKWPGAALSRGHAASSEQILRKYLLGGVAWRCLVLLTALGVEGLSCCRQLSSVLIWVFGEVASGELAAPAAHACAPAPPARTPIHQLFSNRIWTKRRASSQVSKPSILSSEKGPSNGSRSRHSSQQDTPEGKTKRKSSSPSEQSSQSSQSAESNDELEALTRSLGVRVCDNDDFQYFNSSVRSSNEYPDSYASSSYSPRKQKLKADDYINDRHREIMNTEIGAFEFTLMITDLLQELCKAESSLSGSEGSQIAMQCINFSLRNLCSLQFSSESTQNHSREVSRIKVALTELLMVALDKVLIHSDLCAKLINSGILPMMLRILEDVITKRKKDSNRAKETDKTESETSLKVVFGVAYSVTAFFHCLLMQCRSVDKLREFTDQFRLYGECLKGGLLKDCIELIVRIPLIEETEIITLTRKLIETVGKLINGMKRVRSEVIHTAACPRPRHKACRARVAAGMHHHHDILGEPSTALPVASACCISLLYGTLTGLLTDDEVAARSVLRNKILRIMLNCGVCCCFSPGVLMESVVRLTLTHAAAAALCVQLLERTVYGELGAGVLLPRPAPHLPCAVCEPAPDRRDLARKHCHHPIGPVERKNFLSFLIHYNSLLQLDNHNDVLHATVGHLLRVTPKCRTDMKYELLFSVVYPTFIVAKHRYIMRLEEAAYFLTASCLNIFASLLNTVPFAEQFIQKGGLSYVLELVSLPEFSNQCCSILEIAIVVEIFKLMKENSDMTSYREMSSLSSVQMLFKSLSDMTDKCFKIYKAKLPADEYERLVDVTAERAALAFLPSTDHDNRKRSSPQTIDYTFANAESTTEQSIEDHIEVLKNIWTFWKSCAGLCLYSPMFREYVVGEGVFLDSYALLKVVLHFLCQCECAAPEMRLLIKIMEALLTVQLATADMTGGRSKQTSCALVREALASGAASSTASGAASGAALRPLCEALVRVAAAEPSPHHAMPRLTHAKVAGLSCASGGSSSGECSSSEDSAPALYGSEHSDPPAPQDDGYEADVEIGKFDLLPNHKNRRMSSTLSALGALGGVQSSLPERLSAECAEYGHSGDLAHPELAVIVLDILTQLIDKVVSSKSSEEGVSASRAGAALARACCARLAGALGRARAPPRLLHRLLQAPPLTALLTSTHHHLEELQRSVLDLIVVVGSQSVEPAEVAQFLRLFMGERPPLTALLAALQRLLPAQHHTPDHILAFPILLQRHGENMNESLSEDFVQLTMSGVSAQSHLAESSARKLHHAHLRHGIESVWSVGAMRCGVEGAGWAPWLAGFSAVLWLHAPPHLPGSGEEEAARPAPAHVLSLGHDSLILELWTDAHAGELILRLSRPESARYGVMSEARVTAALTRWTCVALNVRETLHKRTMYIQVTVFINGYECESVSLPVQGILVRKVTPTHIVLGHARRADSAAVSVYHVAAVTVYRAALLDVSRAMHLTAHGPDSSCMVRCEAPNYPSLLTPEVLDSNIDWDQVFEISVSSVRELHEGVLLAWTASAPALINLYHNTAPLPAVFAGRGAGGGAGGGGASIPEALRASWSGAPLPLRHRGLAPALYLLHPTEMMLYLYARVVELDGSAIEQATALSILLRTYAHDDRLYAALHGGDALDMLLTVFAAPTCKLTPHLLKVILESACSGAVVRVAGAGAVVAGASDAVVTEPALLVLLARAAAKLDDTQDFSWEEEEGGSGSGTLWALALRCLRVLVRPAHPRRAFNHYQLARVDLLQHLLNACKERYLNSWSGDMVVSASESFVAVVRALSDGPPRHHTLAALTDFLLLMHQASDTFVTHSRANFYFLVTSEPQELSGYDKPARRRKRPDAHDRSPSDTDSNAARDTGQSREHSDHIDSSLDSTKHIKGLINMQIKEGRKHNASSASENSDTTPEAAEGSESEERPADGDKEVNGAGDLAEYIVVDDEDVTHTTVDMYSSGIYHQGRVRAGAAPGWAGSEGLLAVIRDIIDSLPDTHLHQTAWGGVQPAVVLVLANQRSAAARAALVRVLAALQRRAPADLARTPHYYTHLANQISLYECSWELAEACAALVTGCDGSLHEQRHEDVWAGVREEGVLRSGPLLALLPRALHLPALAHHIMHLVQPLIDKASLKALGEVSLVEVLVRCVRALGADGDTDADGDGEWSPDTRALLEAVYALLIRVALKALAPQHTMQTVVDIHHQLSYVEQQCGDGAARAARDAQAALYTAQIDHLHQKLQLSYHQHNTTNYFANVLTSAVSLGGSMGGAGGRGEVCARLSAAAARAVAFTVMAEPDHEPSRHAAALLTTLLRLLTLGVCGPRDRPKWWVGGVGAAECGAALQELAAWALSGAGAGALALRELYYAPQHALAPLAHDPTTARKLAVYVVWLVRLAHLSAEEGGGGAPRLEYAVSDWARDWALALQAALPARAPPDHAALEAAALREQDRARWQRAQRAMRHHIAKAVFSKEGLCARVAEAAMAVTRAAVEAQNTERKRFMEHLRRADAAAAHATTRWQRAIAAHTHQQGVWHCPRSYPQSWQLDPTEGPGRVRVRLRRAHLRIHPRFLKPEYRYKAESVLHPSPLWSVVGGGAAGAGGAGGARGGVVARLRVNETVQHMARAVCVTVDADTHGDLLLTDRCIHFVPEERSPPPVVGSRRKLGSGAGWGGAAPAAAAAWALERVVRVEPRRWCLREVALELFLSSGHAHLLAFHDTNERAAFLRALDRCHLPNKTEPDSLSEAMSQWRSGAITNWEYLMRLNGLGGRSYNDLMQYPVLPFVLADYCSRILDLDEPATFRDLSRPVAIQKKAREHYYIKTYNDLKAASREGSSPLVSGQPHHYGSLYSNSSGVLHYLVRLPPFTELFVSYQDNNFDMPDRTFHSLATTWRLITQDSHTDVKELIPELFYLPELFTNNEGLNLGRRQCGAAVDDVEVPAWAADARLFTLAHRQALEARHVTEALPAWIDLVFGYKQTGQAALDAINVYPACTYYGFDPGALSDEGDRAAAATMVRMYGQTPRRLLRAPHPHRARDLAPHPPQQPQMCVWGGVLGARWGSYCGSPELGGAAVCARRAVAGAAALCPLPAPRATLAVPHNTLPVHLYGESGSNGSGCGPLALLTWGHSDNILRLKRRRDTPPDLLLHVPALDPITVMVCGSVTASAPQPVVMGHASGRVVVARVCVGAARGLPPRVRARWLLAHAAPVVHAALCDRAALLATASRDGTVILWDLNTLTYIRTLPNRDMLPVSLVAISATLADVATVHEPARAPAHAAHAPPPDEPPTEADDYDKDDAYKYKSLIRVHTCNAAFVGSAKVPEQVTSVVYSSAVEGVSVNSVAAGLATGGVRLYSSWDLRPTLYLPPPPHAAPLVSLRYSSDLSVLFGCMAGGAVVAWEAAPHRPAPVRILPAHAIY